MSAYGMGLTASGPEKTYGSLNEATGIDDYLGRLLLFIPADIVAGYTVVIAFNSSSELGSRASWSIAAVFLALSPTLVIAGVLVRSKREHTPISLRDLPWFRVIASIIAFLAWVVALPASPFDSLFEVPWFKALTLVAVTILLAAIAPLFETSHPD